LFLGNSKQINLYSPSGINCDVIWSSSNDKSVTVDATGLIYGLSYGTSIVTVKSVDGKYSENISVEVKRYSPLLPNFDEIKKNVDGFSIQVSNFDNAFSYDVTTDNGESKISDTGLITVSGLAAGESATITVNTTREGYTNGSAVVSGAAQVGDALKPTFGTVSKKPNGFTVQVRNYNASYAFGVKTSKGTASISNSGLITVTGLAPNESVSLTVTTKRTGYIDGSATVSGAAQIGTALTPAFGTVTKTTSGFTAKIINYSTQFKWNATTTSGKVSISKTGLITVTGLSKGKSAIVTITTSRNGYNSGNSKITGSSK
jgi:titin